jgi:hypothetical protein
LFAHDVSQRAAFAGGKAAFAFPDRVLEPPRWEFFCSSGVLPRVDRLPLFLYTQGNWK